MQEVRLNRSNKRALVFIGKEIYRGDTKNYDKERENRWQVVRVFETEIGYVLGIAELTNWMGERDDYATFTPKTKPQIIALVKKRVPELTEDITSALLQKGGDSGEKKEENTAQEDGAPKA